MTDPAVSELIDRLDDLLEDASMPEVVAALVVLSRNYKDQFKAERNGEHQGWEVWETALSDALLRVTGQDQHDDLLTA